MTILLFKFSQIDKAMVSSWVLSALFNMKNTNLTSKLLIIDMSCLKFLIEK